MTLLATAPSVDTLVSEVIGALRSVLGEGDFALHEPRFRGNEWVYVKECIDTTFVSSVGKFVDRFEAELASYTGARRAVAVVNGTAALHMALLLAGVRPGDEVLLPALTFVATANAVVYCGALPHFVDSDEATLGVDPVALRKHLERATEMRGGQCVNRKTGAVVRALVPMHVFGHAADIEALLAVAQDFGLVLVEDAAESLGTTVGQRHTGTFGFIGTLSFNGNKTITTGGGGALLFNDPELGARAKHLTTTAKLPHRWKFEHDQLGYNYRLPNINAALGCAQIEQLPDFLGEKRLLHERYREAFASVRGVRLFEAPAHSCSNYWLQALVLNEDHAGTRDAILQATNDCGLMTRPVWSLMSRLPAFADAPRAPLAVAESLERRIVNIPSSAGLA